MGSDGSTLSNNDICHEATRSLPIFAAVSDPTLQLPSALFMGHRGPVYALLDHGAQGVFLSGSGDGTVVQWDLAMPDQGRLRIQVDQAVFALGHAGPRLLLIGTESGDLHVADLQAGREVQLLRLHSKGIYRFCTLPDQRVACAGGDGTLSIWKVIHEKLELLRQIPLCEEKLRDLALSPDGQHLAVACADDRIRILDTTLFNERFTLQADRTAAPVAESALGFTAVAYHPRKPVLLSGGKDGHLRTWWCTHDHAQLLALPAHKAAIYTLQFGGQGRLATASRDKTVKIWDAEDLSPTHRLDRACGGHTHSVNTCLWLGTKLLTGSDDRRIMAW